MKKFTVIYTELVGHSGGNRIVCLRRFETENINQWLLENNIDNPEYIFDGHPAHVDEKGNPVVDHPAWKS